MELVLRIAGAAGQGVQTLGELLARALFRQGLFVHTEMSYHSRIRGGENAYTVRVSESPVMATKEKAHVLFALNGEMLSQYEPFLEPEGIVICDEGLPPSARAVKVPAEELARKELKLPIAAGMVLLGALSRFLGLDEEILGSLVREAFGDKADVNLRALELGAGYYSPGPWTLPRSDPKGRHFLNGAQGVGAGAIAAGCRFLSSYPMTPGTAVMLYLAGKSAEYGIVVEQAEDEIAAINMALGASYAGARSMVTTSGGGFALMVEGLSLAGMIETPVVIHLAQRPAPATGLPTRTAQEDLLFAIHAGHGEFPRYVCAPRDPREAFYLTVKAFELAEKYQVPAIVLTDQFLIDSHFTVPAIDLSRVEIRDHRLSAEELAELPEYKRFAITDSGVSPRAIPGISEHLVLVDSDEHDEYGRITEDLTIRVRMVEKRLRKGEGLAREIAPPVRYPDEDFKGKTVLLGWGSSFGALVETVDILNQEGGDYALLHFSELWPLRTAELEEAFSAAGEVIAVEGNATGQFARLVAQVTGLRVGRVVGKYDGRPFTPEWIAEEVAR
ncbi:2-oxoacid:acceptor oxidoreductase subunit alpha [Candidatus Bipolaricaulota bacterium]|nr:2-oxoacid:acceptor oxidoreductase subunit alpha [Candidatus Bipolaricaulota bacterium]